MKNINKKIVFPAIALMTLVAVLFTSTSALAQDSSNPESTLVQKIANKFGLDQDEVQKVFDEARSEQKAKMETRQQEKLDLLVKEGKITEAQKTLILNKRKELQSEREANKDSFKDMTPEERKSQMDTKRADLEAWAKENGINLDYLQGGFMMRRGGPHGPR